MQEFHEGMCICRDRGRAVGRNWPPRAMPESCKKVRLSDVGWTDITATTAVTSAILTALGYEPETQVLSVPVTYASLKNKDIDVFLGNWMPSMDRRRQALPRRQIGRSRSRRISKAPATASSCRPMSPTRASRASPTSASNADKFDRQDLRHRARQRRQPHRARHDRRQGERP